MRRSLQVRLLIIFAALAIVPLSTVGALLTWQSYVLQRQQTLDLQHEVTQRTNVLISDFLTSVEREVRLSVRISEIQQADSTQKQTVLSTLLTYRGAFDELDLIDATGQEQVRVSRTRLLTAKDRRDLSQASEFLTPMQTHETYYSPVRFDPESGEPSILMAVPITSPTNDSVTGVLVADVRLKPIWDLVATIRVNNTGFVAIVDADGRVVAHPDPSVVLSNRHFTLPTQDGIATGLSGTEAVLTINTLRYGREELTIIAEVPTSEALAPARRSFITTSVLVLVTLIIASLLGFLAVRTIVKPIQTLAATATAIQNGDLTRRTGLARHDEIGELATAFDTMTSRLRQTLEGLELRIAERTRDLETRNTELAQAFQTLQAQQSQLIIAEQTVRDLGSPAIPVLTGVILVPLVGNITEDRARQFFEVTLSSVAASRSHTLLLDITGMIMADTAAITTILQTARAAALLGTTTVIVGVRPEIAQSIVGLGLDLRHIVTKPTLAAAIESLQRTPASR